MNKSKIISNLPQVLKDICKIYQEHASDKHHIDEDQAIQIIEPMIPDLAKISYCQDSIPRDSMKMHSKGFILIHITRNDDWKINVTHENLGVQKPNGISIRGAST